jgi:hypothetical protein
LRTIIEVQSETLNRLKEVGRKSQSYDRLINQRITCNAAGCEREGKIELKVSAGKYGTVTLFVCEKCVSKFAEPVNEEKTVKAGSKEILSFAKS